MRWRFSGAAGGSGIDCHADAPKLAEAVGPPGAPRLEGDSSPARQICTTKIQGLVVVSSISQSQRSPGPGANGYTNRGLGRERRCTEWLD